MEQRLSFITLGVKNLKKSRTFYKKLGWKESKNSNENVAFFKANGIIFSLYAYKSLAEDAHVSAKGSGFRCVTLAYNVRKKEDVAKILKEAKTAGAKIKKEAQDVFWGGHSGYFADPDGHLWEVAWNPGAKISKSGSVSF